MLSGIETENRIRIDHATPFAEIVRTKVESGQLPIALFSNYEELAGFAKTHKNIYSDGIHSFFPDGSGEIKPPYCSKAEDEHRKAVYEGRIHPEQLPIGYAVYEDGILRDIKVEESQYLLYKYGPNTDQLGDRLYTAKGASPNGLLKSARYSPPIVGMFVTQSASMTADGSVITKPKVHCLYQINRKILTPEETLPAIALYARESE